MMIHSILFLAYFKILHKFTVAPIIDFIKDENDSCDVITLVALHVSHKESQQCGMFNYGVAHPLVPYKGKLFQILYQLIIALPF